MLGNNKETTFSYGMAKFEHNANLNPSFFNSSKVDSVSSYKTIDCNSSLKSCSSSYSNWSGIFIPINFTSSVKLKF